MFGKLTNLYWFIRYYSRNKTKKRKYYRYVVKEKQRLIESGVDKKELSLICRALANRRNVFAERRLEAYKKSAKRSDFLLNFFLRSIANNLYYVKFNNRRSEFGKKYDQIAEFLDRLFNGYKNTSVSH